MKETANRAIRVFVSSPGDVVPERRIAEDVIRRLDREFSSYFRVEGVLWEQEPLLATLHFQAGIASPADADIVVGILWSRLGSPLPGADFPGPISGKPVTGTEFEWETALKAWQEQGWPAVLFFRKTSSSSVDIADRGKRRLMIEQLEKVDAFLDHWFVAPETGIYKNAFREFKEPGEFSQMLYNQLQKLLQDRVTAGAGQGRTKRVEWYQGNPFRGLDSFGFEHAPIFFGRTRARNELREALATRVVQGCAFLTVVGASGSGKSSLVKAGLLPDITIPGMLERVGLCRYAILRPSDGEGDLFGALARALLSQEALPELSAAEYDVSSLSALLRRTGDTAPLMVPLRAAMAAAASKRGVMRGAESRLAIVVDQLEELLTKSIADGERVRFVQVLETLARSGAVMVITTLRSDFLGQLDTIPCLASLTAGSGSWVLHAPNEAELGEMIRLPAEAAGLCLEVRKQTGERLEEVLRQEAAADPASLPLLEYMLAQLWDHRTPEGQLTFAGYEAMGGLAGVLGKRAEEVFLKQAHAVRAELPSILRALVTIAPGEHTQATARSAALASFGEGTPQHALVSAFLEPNARLLVSDCGKVRVAHESLLSHWRRAAEVIATDRRDLQIRARIEESCAEWRQVQDESRNSLLLPPGLRLDEAEDLLQRRRDILDASTIDYIEQSRTKYKAEVARLEWLRLRAETARRRAEAEERFARAQRNELLAARVESRPAWPERDEYLKELRASAAEFRRSGSTLWAEAYREEQELRTHAGASGEENQPAASKGTLLSLEALPVCLGEAVLLHYGERRQPRFILIDGGVRGAFKTGIQPRLAQLCTRQGRRRLPIELIIATHPHSDHVGGIAQLFDAMARNDAPYEVRRFWFNNFVPIGAERFAGSEEFTNSDKLVVRARKLRIPLNRPFDYYVMPSEIGPARVTLDQHVTITVTGPFQQNIQGLAQTQEWNRKRTGKMDWGDKQLPQSLVEQLGGVLAEGFSSPAITLLRNPPDLPPERPIRVSEGTSLNEASIVAVVESHGHRILVPGDANGADILRGLYSAGYETSGGRVHVDVMLIPHFGLMSAAGPEFFEKVTADHYLVFGNFKFSVPRPELIHELHRARKDERYSLHVVLGENSEKILRELVRAAKKEKTSGSRAEIDFHSVENGSLIINLLGTVDY